MVLILVRALTIVEVDEHVSQARVQLVLHLLDVVLSVLAVVALLRLLLLLVVLVLILVILLLSVLLLIAIVALIAIIRVIGMLAFHGLVDVFTQVILAAFFSSVDSIFLGVVLVAVIVTVFIVSFDTVHVLLLALLLHLLLLLLRDSLAVVLINIIVHGNYGLLRLRVHTMKNRVLESVKLGVLTCDTPSMGSADSHACSSAACWHTATAAAGFAWCSFE